jgi:hypothetical protein
MWKICRSKSCRCALPHEIDPYAKMCIIIHRVTAANFSVIDAD